FPTPVGMNRRQRIRIDGRQVDLSGAYCSRTSSSLHGWLTRCRNALAANVSLSRPPSFCAGKRHEAEQFVTKRLTATKPARENGGCFAPPGDKRVFPFLLFRSLAR
ncbi:MAG: hypothetical protein IJS87_06765, partial [Rhodocyclaceae bacterium]|nr:hypothetical protein [Rhodocyclaceae bacterium]